MRDIEIKKARQPMRKEISGLDMNKVILFMIENNIKSIAIKSVGEERADGTTKIVYDKKVFDKK